MEKLAYYLKLIYHLELIKEANFNGTPHYIARYKELEGVCATKEEAISDLKILKKIGLN